MKNINECRRWIESHMDIVIDLVRMYLGIGLFVKGIYFLMHQEELTKLLKGTDNMAFGLGAVADRKSTRLNSSHGYISYAVFCLKKKKNTTNIGSSRKNMRTRSTRVVSRRSTPRIDNQISRLTPSPYIVTNVSRSTPEHLCAIQS